MCMREREKVCVCDAYADRSRFMVVLSRCRTHNVRSPHCHRRFIITFSLYLYLYLTIALTSLFNFIFKSFSKPYSSVLSLCSDDTESRESISTNCHVPIWLLHQHRVRRWISIASMERERKREIGRELKRGKWNGEEMCICFHKANWITKVAKDYLSHTLTHAHTHGSMYASWFTILSSHEFRICLFILSLSPSSSPLSLSLLSYPLPPSSHGPYGSICFSNAPASTPNPTHKPSAFPPPSLPPFQMTMMTWMGVR